MMLRYVKVIVQWDYPVPVNQPSSHHPNRDLETMLAHMAHPQGVFEKPISDETVVLSSNSQSEHTRCCRKP